MSDKGLSRWGRQGERPRGIFGGHLVVVWWTEALGSVGLDLSPALPLVSRVLLTESLFLRQTFLCLYNEDPEHGIRNRICRVFCPLPTRFNSTNITEQLLCAGCWGLSRDE